MKVDKDALVKQRFWVGLGAFALLWLIVLIVALFSAGDKATANAAKVKGQKDAIAGQKDIKNEKFTSLVTEKKEELQGKKNVVWEQAWKGQATMMFWPHPQDKEVWTRLEQQGYFGEDIPPNDRTDYKNTGVYDSQLPVDGDDGIKRALWPIQARGNDWNQLIRRATFAANITPTNEEVWLAQEDLWVQWELLSVVKAALDSAALFENVAHFKRVELPKETDKPAAEGGGTAAATTPAADDAKKPVVLRQRFRNPHWQLDLVLEQNDKGLTATPQTTLKGLDAGPAKPVAGIDLQVGQWAAQPPAAQHLVFEGQPDAKGLLALAKPVALPGFAPNFDDAPLLVTLAADKADPPPQAGTLRHRYRNSNWELELLLEKAPDGQYRVSDKSKVTNISTSQRTLALSSAKFRVLQDRRYLADVTVQDEWLAATNTTEIRKASGQFVLPHPSEPVEVYQEFSWDTSPVKRVDALELPGGTSFNSHRTSNLVLKPAAQFPAPEKPAEAAPTGGAGSGGGMSGMMGGGAKGPGAGLAGSDTSKTPNGLVRDRYISVTEQVRHMPVALELVVDQAHVQDVLTAVVNSRLRIQITQVQWKRIRGVKSAGGDEVASGGGTPGAGTGPGMPGMGGMGPGMPGMGGSGRGSYGGPGSGMYGGGRGGSSPPGGMGPGMSGGSGMGPKPGAGRGYGPTSPVPGGSSSGPSSPLTPGAGSGPGAGRGGAPGAGAGDDSDPNLVQLAVYGIAALYERYPPKPKADAAGAAGGPAAAPAQPTK